MLFFECNDLQKIMFSPLSDLLNYFYSVCCYFQINHQAAASKILMIMSKQSSNIMRYPVTKSSFDVFLSRSLCLGSSFLRFYNNNRVHRVKVMFWLNNFTIC